MIATPTTPRPQKTLHICNSNLEAYHIKNAIQRVAPIGVVIEKTNNQIKILVDDCNYKTAHIILQTAIRTLKAITKNAKVETYKVPVKKKTSKNVLSIAFDLVDNLLHKHTLERSILS
ncbi:hypothetical protein Q4595_09310 [Wenyingzhuangia sp. 1_MG-2023]|nr:hypothetical protein [Wenyingzhuangia sp. 1_MG-2023]